MCEHRIIFANDGWSPYFYLPDEPEIPETANKYICMDEYVKMRSVLDELWGSLEHLVELKKLKEKNPNDKHYMAAKETAWKRAKAAINEAYNFDDGL